MELKEVLRILNEHEQELREWALARYGSATIADDLELTRLLKDKALHRRMSRAQNPYGDGKASERIAAAIALWKLR